jgi:hypothetical protein
MKRRAFLAGLTTVPWWIRRAFADASVATVPPLRTRPTLVWVVPRDELESARRAAAFGRLLMSGSDRDLAPLALMDVVCAPADGDPLMVYVVGNKTRRLDGRLADIPELIRSVAPASERPIGELAAIARERYLKKAPRGARWGQTSGCGVVYDDGSAIDCGMGSVDEPSRRFLDFYVRK